MICGRLPQAGGWMFRIRFGLLVALLVAAPARAQIPVDLELVVAVDISRSVDDQESKLQRDGYIAAFTDRRVIEAIQSGAIGAIAVAYVEWAGVDHQRTSIDWFLIRDGESAGEFAARLGALPRVALGWTSISGVIDYSARMFGQGYEGLRRVIDISGDGVNNSGRAVWRARDDAVAQGIVINGLPILNDRPNFGRPAELNLDYYYETQVIGGPGSFMIAAEGFEAFGAAILAKLIREIAEAPPQPQ
jgi:Protein of unknown function (DUF1194)